MFSARKFVRVTARALTVILVLAAFLFGLAAVTYPELLELFFVGDARQLRARTARSQGAHNARPKLLVLALDGVRRDVLYQSLREGLLPNLSKLLGGRSGTEHPHAYFSESMVSVLPSSTAPAWSTAFTGALPAVHGITGNEYFVREAADFVAHIPMSFKAPEQVLQTYTDSALNRDLNTPTVYEQMRAREPDVHIWVSMSQVFQGADRLLLANRAVLVGAFRAYIYQLVAGASMRTVYEEIDEEVMENLVEALGEQDAPAPDVVTLYIAGADHYAHMAKVRPVGALRDYLQKSLDPMLESLYQRLVERGALEDRFVVVVADHGISDVDADADHSLLGTKEGTPPEVLQSAGFRVRPFGLGHSAEKYQAVLAYQGALAYVYLADRSRCVAPENPCEWRVPPRYEEDVLVAAEALFQHMKRENTLQSVLIRQPTAERTARFEVYLGGGRTRPLDEDAFATRLRSVTEGPFGDRAGDLILMSAMRVPTPQRYYFSGTHEAGHGGASPEDSEVPFIVAHPRYTSDALASRLRPLLGEWSQLDQVTPVLLELRYGAPSP